MISFFMHTVSKTVPPGLLQTGPLYRNYARMRLPLQADAILPNADLVAAATLGTRKLAARRF